MKRLHVHVSVDCLADSIRFYSTMFDSEPSVVKPDYAKWMLEDPKVNFAISTRGAEIGLNHLGIQVDSDTELRQMECRVGSLQPGVEKEEGVTCCYAKSDKYWVTDPSGIAWETFRTLDTVPVFGEPKKTDDHQPACCIPLHQAKPQSIAACCVPLDSAKQETACC